MKKKPSTRPRSKSPEWYCQQRGDETHPPVLFLHGFMGLSDDWLEIVEPISAKCHCIVPELPGHGKSGFPIRKDSITFESVAAGLVRLLDDLKIPQATLVGYSMGGRVALFTALQYPDRVNALVLESASPGLEDAYERHVRAALDDDRAYHMRVLGMDAFLDDWYKMPLFESLTRFPQRLMKLKRSRSAHNIEGLAAALQGLSTGKQPSLWNRLGTLKVPTLLVCGALDHTFTRINRSMSEAIPLCEWKIIGDAGHNVHLEHPEAFAVTLERFLAAHVLKVK